MIKHTLQFKRPGGTSRGILKTKDSWIAYLMDGNALRCVGEASLIQRLSPEDPSLMMSQLNEVISHSPLPSITSIPKNFPSIRFALEMLQKGVEIGDPTMLYENAFSSGQEGIPINGLIWMGDKHFMFNQIKSKLADGYSCLKLKIGAINFEEELALLSYVRQQYSKKDVSIRVDANGAFTPAEALEKLKRLSDLQIHSIEQPIRQGQWNEMATLCSSSPIDIALDEELIGVYDTAEKKDLLETIQPQYIILKPSLLGGWKASEEWIELASSKDIGWWATSALESNIGLNAIAQWVGSLNITLPQGLGTGSLYTNNINAPLYIKNAQIWYDPEKPWDHSLFKKSL